MEDMFQKQVVRFLFWQLLSFCRVRKAKAELRVEKAKFRWVKKFFSLNSHA
jgi:hypothetical protein